MTDSLAVEISPGRRIMQICVLGAVAQTRGISRIFVNRGRVARKRSVYKAKNP